MLAVSLDISGQAAVAQELNTNFTIDGVSPFHINNTWLYNEKSSHHTHSSKSSDASSFVMIFVGNSFQMFGPVSGTNTTCAVNGKLPVNLPVDQSDETELISDAKSSNTFYHLGIIFDPESSLEFHNVRFNMTIKTEARALYAPHGADQQSNLRHLEEQCNRRTDTPEWSAESPSRAIALYL